MAQLLLINLVTAVNDLLGWSVFCSSCLEELFYSHCVVLGPVHNEIIKKWLLFSLGKFPIFKITE